jgi:hypothetical protein
VLRHRRFGRLRRSAGLGIGILTLVLPAFAGAQAPTGVILGLIVDPTGGILRDVAIVVVNEDTAARRVTTTGPTGRFEVGSLPPGPYRVEATMTGYRPAVRSGLLLQVNQQAFVSLTLELGPFVTAVVVRAPASAVNGYSATVGTVIDQQKLVDLPLNGRDFFQLAALVPGALPAAEGSQNANEGGAVSLNGAREQSNNFLLDGIDNNNLVLNQVVVHPSVDAVEEFKVQSSSYSAEFGRSGGAQFNFVTRSGSNRYSASVYEFLRNAALDARNAFDDPDRPIPQFQRNLFGGTASGPLRRDRTFFFVSVEGLRVRQALTRRATVPPLAWVNGDFSSLLTGATDPATGFDRGQLFDPRTGLPLPGNVIPATLLDPAGSAIARFYPAPDDPAALGPSVATVTPKHQLDGSQVNARIDDTIGTHARLFGRYTRAADDRFNPFDLQTDATNVPGFGHSVRNRAHSAVAAWTQVLSDTMVNDVRVGWNRSYNGLFQEHQGDDVSSALGITGLSTDPAVVGRPGSVLSGTDNLIDSVNLPQESTASTWHFVETLTWQRGDHSFKTGFDLRRFSLDFYLYLYARGQFTYAGLSGNSLADLLLGVPVTALRQDPAVDALTNLRTTSFSGFFQDDWRVRSDLTLNLGVRYEFNQPITDTEDRFSIPDLENPDGGFLQAGANGIPRAGYDADVNNVAPRIGAAWRPFNDERTVVRGAYGVFYDVGIANANVLPRLNPPYFALNLALGPLDLNDAFSGPAIPLTVANGIADDYRDGVYQHWNVNVQRAMRPELVLDVGYFGSRGRSLLRRRDRNQGPEGGPPVSNPAFGPAVFSESTARSAYRALQVRLERQATRNVSFLAAYTWAHSRDDASSLFGSTAAGGPLGGVPQNSADPEAEWAPSDFDAPHRFAASVIWDLPLGADRKWLSEPGLARAIAGDWQVAAILTLQSGRPFTVYYGASANYSGTDNGANGGPGFDRPNQIGDPEVSRPSPAQWFNPAAFVPPSNSFGAVGRNTLRGDGVNNVDLAFYKSLPTGRDGRLQVRIEIFNVFNANFYALPVGDLTKTNAGSVTRASDARQIQLALKLLF